MKRGKNEKVKNGGKRRVIRIDRRKSKRVRCARYAGVS